MTIEQTREELFKTIWKVVDELKLHVDAWEFKNYVLGFLFYRYISEDFSRYVNERVGTQENFDYSQVSNDAEWLMGMKTMFIQEKGYFIYPQDLFINILKCEDERKDNLNQELGMIFRRIEEDAKSGGARKDFEGLFSYMDLSDNKLGKEIHQTNARIKQIMEGISKLELNFDEADLFGDAYEYLIGRYTSDAGKSGGQHFTPPEVSQLMAAIVKEGKQGRIDTVYDPTCGSGSLLLKFKNEEDVHLYGQEIDETTYNLCRMNMFLHNVSYSRFDIEREDTLENDMFRDIKFDVVVSNPPYSRKWRSEEGTKGEEMFMADPRFKDVGVLAPKTKSDFAFILHSLYHMKDKQEKDGKASWGMGVIVCFPGILFREKAEKEIRKWLIDNNYIEAIIQLKDNLFYGTSIATCLLVLQKHREKDDVLFINATDHFSKGKKRNVLSEENRNDIVQLYKDRKDVEKYAKVVTKEEIQKEDYTLSVDTYVIREEEEQVIDIDEVNRKIKEGIEEIIELEKQINKLIEEF